MYARTEVVIRMRVELFAAAGVVSNLARSWCEVVAKVCSSEG